MSIEPPLYREIIDFWHLAGSKHWFKRDADFDAEIRLRYEAVHHAAARSEYAEWADTAEGALALILLLDQFPRNLYRGSAHSYATDPLARKIADAAVGAGHDRAVGTDLRVFFYLPFEHAELLADQDRSVLLTGALHDKEWLRYAELHRDVVRRFGRFPHRNVALGRVSTPEEIAFLADGGFSA